MKTMNWMMAAAVFMAMVAAVQAQIIQGTGNNSGSGWRSDGIGGFQGTGNNSGGGWRSDGIGGFRGTGNNSGGGWR